MSSLCPRCNKQPKTTSGLCRPCHNQYKRERYRTSTTARQQVRIDAWKRQGINITWDQYQQLLAEQNGLCNICHQPPTDGRALHVDHDHTTGEPRSLLCSPCNVTLGNVQENAALLRAMADYLDHHKASYLVAMGR